MRLIIGTSMVLFLALGALFLNVSDFSTQKNLVGQNNSGNANINYTQIKEEVINLESQYFEFNDTNINITQEQLPTDGDRVVLGQFESDSHGNTMIRISSDYVEIPSVYKAVLTHEYLHFVLYQLGIQSIKNSTDLNEGLTHTFTWFANKQIQIAMEGENASNQQYPYTLIIGQIFTKDEFNCLDKVFDKENKIKSIEDYKNRLRVNCNVSI